MSTRDVSVALSNAPINQVNGQDITANCATNPND